MLTTVYILTCFRSFLQGFMKTLNVHDIRKKPADVSFSLTAEDLPSLKEAETSGECRLVTPITGTLHAEAEFDHIRVNGFLSCSVELSCSRCLKPFILPISESFTVFYSESPSDSGMDPEIELAEQDLLSAYFVGDEISPLPEISDQVLMQIPMKPLCDERCRGLCPTCGADLNEGPCSCDGRAGSFHFSALAGYRVKTDKGE